MIWFEFTSSLFVLEGKQTVKINTTTKNYYRGIFCGFE